MLPLNLSDTAATSQDGSSLDFIAAIADRHCYILDASGRRLWALLLGFKTGGKYIIVFFNHDFCIKISL